MNARQKAHAELQHALGALGDGSGHDCWGPAPVGDALYNRDGYAGQAFDVAASAAFMASLVSVRSMTIAPETRPAFISAMRKLAPVILDIRLDALGVE